MSYFQAQRYRLALEKLESLLSSGKHEPAQQEAGWRLLGDCLYYLGLAGVTEARVRGLEVLKSLPSKYPGNERENILVHYKLARIYEVMDFDYEALQQYEKFGKLNTDPKYDQETRYKIGLLLNRVRRYRQSVERLGELLKKYPTGPYSNLAMYVMGDSFLQLKQDTLARVWFTEARKASPVLGELPKEILFINGLYEFKFQRYREAIAFLLPVINFFPQDRRTEKAMELLADSYAGMGANERALIIYGLLWERTLDSRLSSHLLLKIANIGVTAPGIAVAENLPGRDYYLDPIKAYDRLYNEASSLDVREELLIRKSLALVQKGEYTSALEIYTNLLRQAKASKRKTEIIKLAQETAMRYLDELHGRGAHLEMLDLYLRLAEQGLSFPEGSDLMLRVAKSMERLGLYQQARDIYEKLQAREQDKVKQAAILLSRIEIAITEGKYADAEANLNLLQSEPKIIDKSIKNRALMLAAQLSLKTGATDRAIAYYGQAVALGAELSIPELLNYAYALEKHNNLPAALAVYERAINNLVTQKKDRALLPVAYLRLADLLFNLKRYQQSLEAYQQSLNAKPTAADARWAAYQMGNIYVKLQQYPQAQKAFANLKDQAGNDAWWAKLADHTLMQTGKNLAAAEGEGERTKFSK